MILERAKTRLGRVILLCGLRVDDTRYGCYFDHESEPCFQEERQQGAVEPQQRIPGAPQHQEQPEEEEFNESAFTSSLDRKSVV